MPSRLRAKAGTHGRLGGFRIRVMNTPPGYLRVDESKVLDDRAFDALPEGAQQLLLHAWMAACVIPPELEDDYFAQPQSVRLVMAKAMRKARQAERA